MTVDQCAGEFMAIEKKEQRLNYEQKQNLEGKKIVKKEDPPSEPPRLNEMIRMIASLGGYVKRKSTEPGPQTLWVGLQRVLDLSTAWETFGPK